MAKGEFEDPIQRDPSNRMKEVDEWARTIQRMGKRYKETGKFTSDTIDSQAFDTMQNVTKGKASNLFTESAYNTLSTNKERKLHDQKAYNILKSMYNKDKSKHEFKDIDFNRYIDILNPALFDERALHPDDDDLRVGDFFLDVYEGDFDQFRDSALTAARK